jgi:hypothetical protein
MQTMQNMKKNSELRNQLEIMPNYSEMQLSADFRQQLSDYRHWQQREQRRQWQVRAS